MADEPSRRVLVADDDAEIRGLLGEVLRRRSIHVDEATNGAEVIRMVDLHRYDVLLLDLVMPEVNGFDVLHHLERDGKRPSPIVLVITGADRAVTKGLDSQRIHGIVRKPFDVEEIAAIVVACTEIRERNAFGTMALATMLAGSPLLALLNRFPH